MSTPTDTSASDTSAPGTGRPRRVATAAVWVATGAIAATALTGVAFAAERSTAGAGLSTASQSASSDLSARATGRRAGPLRTVLHGTLTVQGPSGPTEVTLQRGTVTAASATSVTVASTDGFRATYAITASTVVKRDRTTVTGDKLAVGDTAVVRASSGTATVVRDLSPEAAAKARSRAGHGGSTGSGASSTPSGATPSSSSTG